MGATEATIQLQTKEGINFTQRLFLCLAIHMKFIANV